MKRVNWSFSFWWFSKQSSVQNLPFVQICKFPVICWAKTFTRFSWALHFVVCFKCSDGFYNYFYLLSRSSSENLDEIFVVYFSNKHTLSLGIKLFHFRHITVAGPVENQNRALAPSILLNWIYISLFLFLFRFIFQLGIFALWFCCIHFCRVK